MEQRTLLTLNDDCLLNIFTYLNAQDSISLASTCHRLRNAAICAKVTKYKEITVDIIPAKFRAKNPMYKKQSEIKHEGLMKKRELMAMLSLIGAYVSSFSFIGNSPFIHEVLKKVLNLKELKLDKDFATKNTLADYFSVNCQLQSVECWYERGVFELLKMLPNLTSLRLYDLPSMYYRNESFEDLFCLNRLTKFAFKSSDRYNNFNLFLKKLAKSINLLELNIHASVNEETFGIISTFRNLERLTIYALEDSTFRTATVPETLVLPPKLNFVKFGGFTISCNCILSIVNNLKLLNEFDIGYCYIADQTECFSKHMRMVISRIENELILNPQRLKLIYLDTTDAIKNNPDASNLYGVKIVSSFLNVVQRKSQRIVIIDESETEVTLPFRSTHRFAEANDNEEWEFNNF